MSTQIQQLRGNTSENNNFTGAPGVITVDTERKDIRVHDGVTKGGFSLLDRSQGLSKDGGTIDGNLVVSKDFTVSGTVRAEQKYILRYDGDPRQDGTGYEIYSSQNTNCSVRLGYAGGGGLLIRIGGYGNAAVFQTDGGVNVGEYLSVGYQARLHKDGNIQGSVWEKGYLYTHINDVAWRFASDRAKEAAKWCVTGARVAGWAEISVPRDEWTHLPAGFYMTSVIWGTWGFTFAGSQPQIYVEGHGGWLALA